VGFALPPEGLQPSSTMQIRPLLLGLALLVTALASPAAEVRKIAAADAAKLVAEGKAVLVDVREAPECAESGLASPAVWLPKSDFDGDQKLWKPFLEKNAGKEILLYCRVGGRAASIATDLAAKGFKTANLGGLKDWTGAGLPTRPAEPAAAKK
jgi:hypothetical protein